MINLIKNLCIASFLMYFLSSCTVLQVSCVAGKKDDDVEADASLVYEGSVKVPDKQTDKK